MNDKTHPGGEPTGFDVDEFTRSLRAVRDEDAARVVVPAQAEISVFVVDDERVMICTRAITANNLAERSVSIPLEHVRAVAKRMLEHAPGRRGIALRHDNRTQPLPLEQAGEGA